MEKFFLQEVPGVALLLKYETGIVWQHQCGGTCCLQREAEGFILPLSRTMSADDPLYDLVGASSQTAQKFLDQLYLSDDLELVEGGEFHEAWIEVRVADKPTDLTLRQFAGWHGFLITENSD